MPVHSDSRPSTADRSSQSPERSSRSRDRWNPYLDEPDIRTIEQAGPRQSREAIPPPQGEGVPQASAPSSQTNELLETLSTLTDKVKDTKSRDALVDTVKKFAKTMQQKVAELTSRDGTPPREGRSSVPANDVATSRFSSPPRSSLSHSLDGYRPDRDVTAPISVRPNAMELLWVCGDCGQHYPRARQCPDVCTECGAPKQHFYAPIED